MYTESSIPRSAHQSQRKVLGPLLPGVDGQQLNKIFLSPAALVLCMFTELEIPTEGTLPCLAPSRLDVRGEASFAALSFIHSLSTLRLKLLCGDNLTDCVDS